MSEKYKFASNIVLRPVRVCVCLIQTLWLFCFNLCPGIQGVALGNRLVRQEQNSTLVTSGTQESSWFAQNWPWIVLVILLAVASSVAGVCLILCCILRHSHLRERQAEINQRKKKKHFNSDSHLLNHGDSPQKLSSGNSSSTCVLGVNGGPGEHSARVSSSSLQSYEKSRRKYPSPGHSSGSEEGLKVHLEHEKPVSNRQFGRRRSGSLVHISTCDESDLSLVSVPSLTSVDASNRNCLEPSQPTVIEVSVTVGGTTSERESQITTAAALAESAAKLAQSAATMGDPTDDMWQIFQKRNGEWMMRYRATNSLVSNGPRPPVSQSYYRAHQHPEVSPTVGGSENQHDPFYQMRVNGSLYGSHAKFPSRVPSQNGSLSPLKIISYSPNYNPYCGGDNGEGSPSSSHISRRLSYQYADLDRHRTGGHYGSCSPKRRTGPLSRGSFSYSRSTNSSCHSPTRELRPLSKRPCEDRTRHNTLSKETHDSEPPSATDVTRLTSKSSGESSMNHLTCATEAGQLRHQLIKAPSIGVVEKDEIKPDSDEPFNSTSQMQQTSFRHHSEERDVHPPSPRRPSAPSLVSNKNSAENKVTSSSRSASTNNLHIHAPHKLEEKNHTGSVGLRVSVYVYRSVCSLRLTLLLTIDCSGLPVAPNCPTLPYVFLLFFVLRM
jgi:hypothetical protein